MTPHWLHPGLGHGRAWLLDHWTDMLVSVDMGSLDARIHPQLPPRTERNRLGEVLVTGAAVWLGRDRQLLRVEPDGSNCQAVHAGLRGDRAWWAGSGDAVFGTDWPSGRVTRVGEDGSVRTVELGGHLERLAAHGHRLWVVDRADESLLGLDAATLAVTARVPFDGGRIAALWPVNDTVLVSHNVDLRRDGEPSVWQVSAAGHRELIWRLPATPPELRTTGWFAYTPGDDELLSRKAPRVGATDGVTLWISRGADDPYLPTDPISTILPITLATGESAPPIALPGQIDDLQWAHGRLWRSGFVRSRQATALTAIGLIDGVPDITEVDLSGIDLTPYQPVPQPAPAPDYDAELDDLPERLREYLTVPGQVQDQRTGRMRPARRPAVHEHFVFLGLALDRAAHTVRLTFGWATEPGVRFAYDHALPIPPITGSITFEASVFITEQLATGLVYRAHRQTHDDHVLLLRRSPDDQT